MEKTKEAFDKELKLLQEVQSEKGKALAEKKKAGEDTSSLLEELRKVKEEIKVLSDEIKKRFPTEQKTTKPGGVTAKEAKEKRAAEARKAQEAGQGNAKKAGKKRIKKDKKAAEVDKTDVTRAVLSAAFAGTRFRSNEPPVVPIEGQRNILITSALPYVNNVPHLGNIIGSVLSADVFARYCRLRQINTVFICGTDEYGTATETKALQEGVTPIEICNKFSKIHDEIYQWFGISFDHFGRTTTPEQTEIAQEIFLKIHKNNYLAEDTVEQLYCPTCDRYLADRLVEGTCPHPGCGYTDARGDQCDKCQKLINATELIDPKCKSDGTRPVQRESEHLFIKLPELTEKLVPWIKESSVKGNWTANGVAITNSWLSTGLQNRCITRDLKWGVPVPLEKYSSKVLYVWFDAPIGYISITATYTKQWEKWWKNPSQVQLYQFMGKDNIPFHTVIFPSSLLATGDDWTLLHHVSTTEYLNYENKKGELDKFSKSRGIGVFGDSAQTTEIPQEVWRYYLLASRPETSDTVFSWDELVVKNNTELLDNLGNFCFRCLSFTKERGVVPKSGTLTAADTEFIEKVNSHLAQYLAAMDEVKLKEGLRIAVIEISAAGNAYWQDQKPWELIKTDKERCNTVLTVALNLTVLLGAVLEPFIPSFSEKLFLQLAVPHIPIPTTFSLDLIKEGHNLGDPAPIFRKLQKEEVAAFKERFG